MISASRFNSRKENAKRDEQDEKNQIAARIPAANRSFANGLAGAFVFTANRFED